MFTINGVEMFDFEELHELFDDVMFTGDAMPKVHIVYKTVKAPKVITPEHQAERIKAAKDEALSDAVHSMVNSIVRSIDRQENPKYRTISECEIISNGYLNEVWVRSNCDGWCEDVKMLFSYYPDELSFSEYEFIGRTEDSARAMFHDRDIAYLRR